MLKPLQIAIGGSAADPPHCGHLALLFAMLKLNFDLVIWILSGNRPDKKMQAVPNDRVAMTELLIPDRLRLKKQPRLVINYQDAYVKNTASINWLRSLQRQYPQAKIVWYTGVDSIVPKPEYSNRCQIEALWVEGDKLIRDHQFLIIPRTGFKHPESLRPFLPDYFRFTTLDVELPDVASSKIRQAINKGVDPQKLVKKGWLTQKVAQYIINHNLYKQ